MSLNIRPLSPELAKIAQEELNEVPSRIPEDIAAFRSWIEKQPHIRGRTDDQFLVMFLRGCKYSIERAKEKYDMYYTLRSAIPELFANRDPTDPRMLDILRMGTTVPLPKTASPVGPRIILSRFGNMNPDKFKFEDVMKSIFMMGEIMTQEDDALIVCGQVGLADFTGASLAQFAQMTPSWSKKMSVLTQEGNPLRMKGAHYINTPTGFETVFNIFKNFMTEKNKKRLYVHGSDMEKVYQHIPKELLPSEYGGEAGPISDMIKVWEKKYMEYRDYFVENDKYGVDEKKRPGKPKNAESLFGVDGSFRKLDVD